MTAKAFVKHSRRVVYFEAPFNFVFMVVSARVFFRKIAKCLDNNVLIHHIFFYGKRPLWSNITPHYCQICSVHRITWWYYIAPIFLRRGSFVLNCKWYKIYQIPGFCCLINLPGFYSLIAFKLLPCPTKCAYPTLYLRECRTLGMCFSKFCLSGLHLPFRRTIIACSFRRLRLKRKSQSEAKFLFQS